MIRGRSEINARAAVSSLERGPTAFGAVKSRNYSSTLELHTLTAFVLIIIFALGVAPVALWGSRRVRRGDH